MSTAARRDPLIERVEVTDDGIRSSRRRPGDQCARYEIIGDGQGVHWPDIDEDIGAEGNTGAPDAEVSARAGGSASTLFA
jgi:uncharacterized protein DUF2442